MIFFRYLDNLSWGIGSVIVVLLFIAFSVIGTVIVRSLVNTSKLKAHHDVAGYVFANLGVLYSVLLGFTVVNVQQRFDKINEITQTEASHLEELYRNSEVFSESDGNLIRNSIKAYTESVINDEWPSLSNREFSQKTKETFNLIWKAYYNVGPLDSKQQTWYGESINKLNMLMNARLSRMLGGQESLGSEMWVLLILGGLVIISFMWFFGLDKIGTHLLMTSILASVTAFMLYLIYSLDTAFVGDVNIAPEAFKDILSFFR